MCDDEDVEIVFELKPMRKHAELAARLMLPPTFFCYKNHPGYLSDDDNDGKIHTLFKYSLVSVTCKTKVQISLSELHFCTLAHFNL